MRKKTHEGFTLIELMIVVSIIGLLAAIAIPKFGDMLEKAREGATKTGQSTLRSAISTYFADQVGVYPMTLDSATFTLAGQGFPAFLPTYLEDVPAVKVTAKNRQNPAFNHGPGVGTSADTVTYGNYSVPAFATDGSGSGWKYESRLGWVWVNSTQVDMAGMSYTLFGLQ